MKDKTGIAKDFENVGNIGTPKSLYLIHLRISVRVRVRLTASLRVRIKEEVWVNVPIRF